MSLPTKCLNAVRHTTIYVNRPIKLVPRAFNNSCPALIEKFSTTTECKFKTEHPSNNESKPRATFKIEYPSPKIEKIPNGTSDLEQKEKNDRRLEFANHGEKYTPEEEKLILNFVEQHGDNVNTFKLLEGELARYYRNIQYKFNAMKKPRKETLPGNYRQANRRFSKADDEMILNYVNEHGEYFVVFKEIADQLNVRWWKGVQRRYNILMSEKPLQRDKNRQSPLKGKPKPDGPAFNNLESLVIPMRKTESGDEKNIWPNNYTTTLWTIEEDKRLLDIVMKDTQKVIFKGHIQDDYEVLCSLEAVNFTSMSKEHELPRKVENCRGRWKQVILPICKTYVLGNPGFPENYLDWKKNVVNYIVDNKIEDKNDIDAYEIEKNLCPGQTVASIKKFVNGIYQTSRKYDETEPLFMTCSRRFSKDGKLILINNDFRNYFHKENHIQEVVDHYKVIARKWNGLVKSK